MQTKDQVTILNFCLSITVIKKKMGMPVITRHKMAQETQRHFY